MSRVKQTNQYAVFDWAVVEEVGDRKQTTRTSKRRSTSSALALPKPSSEIGPRLLLNLSHHLPPLPEHSPRRNTLKNRTYRFTRSHGTSTSLP